LIGQAIKYGTCQKAEQTRNNVVEFAFTATGGASAWSVPGEGHAHAEHQPAYEISNNVGCGDIREGEQTQAA
jgi:hypothetical protein